MATGYKVVHRPRADQNPRRITNRNEKANPDIVTSANQGNWAQQHCTAEQQPTRDHNFDASDFRHALRHVFTAITQTTR
jgi:hypothetical protein